LLESHRHREPKPPTTGEGEFGAADSGVADVDAS